MMLERTSLALIGYRFNALPVQRRSERAYTCTQSQKFAGVLDFRPRDRLQCDADASLGILDHTASNVFKKRFNVKSSRSCYLL
jgi:hypothetical protein